MLKAERNMIEAPAVPCNLNIDMVFREPLFRPAPLYVTKRIRDRLVDEFPFGYNQPAIIILGQKFSEAL